MPIDLEPGDLASVRAILERHLPGREVRVFGSRVFGKAKEFSDLDLAVMGEAPVGDAVLADLRDAFRESDLPFKVDILEWATTRESFRRIVERESIALRAERVLTS
jgi:type I restriction enzyme S subunit